jgi:hypothetical protein
VLSRRTTERAKGGVDNERQRGVELTQDQQAKRRGGAVVFYVAVLQDRPTHRTREAATEWSDGVLMLLYSSEEVRKWPTTAVAATSAPCSHTSAGMSHPKSIRDKH